MSGGHHYVAQVHLGRLRAHEVHESVALVIHGVEVTGQVGKVVELGETLPQMGKLRRMFVRKKVRKGKRRR